MTLRELQIGMPLRPKRWFATSHSVRVEFVAWDWAVVRDVREETYLVHRLDEPFELAAPESTDQTHLPPST